MEVVTEIPDVQIADFSVDVPEALDRLQTMLVFHLECLREKGKPIPTEDREEEGFYLRVKLPAESAIDQRGFLVRHSGENRNPVKQFPDTDLANPD